MGICVITLITTYIFYNQPVRDLRGLSNAAIKFKIKL